MLANVFTKTVRDRWKGMVIGAVTLAIMLVFGMSMYRDLDLSVYTDLPEAFRSLIGITEDTDAAGLAYGAIYSSYGALTVAALALAMGSASIAGEEREGTIGLLLANPKSRTRVLASKAASLVLLTAVGILILWGAGLAAPELLGVNVGGMHIGALMAHMFVNALFYGFLAMAVGAWTGNRGLASGVTAGVMVVSFLAAGILPIVEGLESAAKVFPWYYYESTRPVLNGLDAGHLGVLAAAVVLLAAVAVVGVNRRDLKSQTVGVTLLDRLRANPATRKVAERLAGSTRVSRISVKTVSDHQGLVVVTAVIMLWMGVVVGPMYNSISDALAGFTDTFPEAVLAVFGAAGGDISTPEGWLQVEIFGLMAPICVMVATIVIGARALAGEEARRTMGLLLANPIRRARVVLEKAAAMLLGAVAVGCAIFAGVAVGSLIGGLGVSMAGLAATSLLATLLGLVFGGVALALSAATGREKVALFGAAGLALVFHLLNAFLPLSEGVAGYAKISPSYYYLTGDPLTNGMAWSHGGLLAGLAAVLVACSVVLFDRRDLRQTA